ncbi:hypothetical protein F4561_002680 [Lipingzhangella halophila]|uniref:GIY-YIG nuclease family protein n=1 Tax=Lipingzhangella halophila TaxID=1783352 RepID=A0A7W7W3L8_9ACTN|nr:GIY-YIG nuclease family protein [Lipingzhangella halophila]MBB4931860.1 hypothetical protein [Lipingzhangella halophila]
MKIVLNDPQYQVKAVLDFAAECQAKHERQRETRPSRVYYVQIGDAIKIGTTINVRQRMNGYPPNKRLLAVEDGGYDVEAERHRQFASFVAFGKEWFRPEAPLIKHINGLREKRGAKPIPVPKIPKKK